MRKLYLTFCLLFLVSGLVFAQDQLTIGWNTSSIVVDAGVLRTTSFCWLKWEDVAPTQGIWSLQIDITSQL
jgi:hypothetical protein